MADNTMNTAPLKGKIREVFGSQEKFAEEVGLSLTQVSNILNGKAGMSHTQIISWAQALHIDLSSTEFNRVFFSPNNCENTSN